MKNKYLFFGTLIMVMAFALVLAGCATTVETPATPDQQAEQLAAVLAGEINAIKEGSAVVEGAKVTLTSGVDLTTSLTVPAGITLDLTADGAKLILKNGTTLTVNGTVDAKNEGITIDSEAATPALINGSGTINLKSKGRLLNIGQDKKITLDGVTLVGLKDNDKPLVEIGNDGEFVLKSGKITGNSITGSEWVDSGGVKVSGGTFTMEGGEISGNSAISSKEGSCGGGGVALWGEALFTIKGGTISDNRTGGNGGGVYVGQERCTFIMEGGAISGNSAGAGAGVKVNKNATFTMEGGVISGNSAVDGGGGVDVNGTFTMKGGRIQGGQDSDGFTANTGGKSWWAHALAAYNGSTAKWGTGGTYTIAQRINSDGTIEAEETGIGGSDIVKFNDKQYGCSMRTLIATPAP